PRNSTDREGRLSDRRGCAAVVRLTDLVQPDYSLDSARHRQAGSAHPPALPRLSGSRRPETRDELGETDGHRKHDGRALLARDVEKCAEIAELHGFRLPSQDRPRL